MCAPAALANNGHKMSTRVHTPASLVTSTLKCHAHTWGFKHGLGCKTYVTVCLIDLLYFLLNPTIMSSYYPQHHIHAVNTLRKFIHCDWPICVHGLPQSGKTTLVKQFFKERPDLIQVYLDCDELTSPSDLLIRITNGLAEQITKNKNVKPQKLMNNEDFYIRITELAEKAPKEGRVPGKFFVILDNVHRWKKTFIFDNILMIETLSSMIHLVLISDENMANLIDYVKAPSTRAHILDRAVNIEILAWEKNDIIDLILQDLPKRYKTIYKIFVKIIVPLFHENRTKNFLWIRNYCQLHFEDFINYYQNNLNGPVDDKKISTMSSEESKALSTAVTELGIRFWEQIKKTGGFTTDSHWYAIDQEVTLNKSILIIAVYIAANTSVVDDRQNFVRYQKKTKMRKEAPPMDDEENETKTFTMERIIQIYRALTKLSAPSDRSDEAQTSSDTDLKPEPFDDSILSDLQFLEDIRMVQIYSGDGIDSLTRYKIGGHVIREYVERIAKQADFTLSQYCLS